ncbi:MAG: protein kinase [archaeon]|nr:protein kinase [archaeon]
MDNYTVLEEICRTQFSTILRCKNKKTKEIVVLKQIVQKKIDESPSKQVLRELLVLMNFDHPNIVKYHSVFVHYSNIVIEMEFCISSLSQIIKQISKPFHVAQIKKIIRSIAIGLKFLHDHDIVHRDIKPGNIFIDENCTVKLGDFGSSRILGENIRQVTPSVGTKWYKAPEIIFAKKNYTNKVDIWSFGCLIAELFLLEPLFPGATDFEMVNMIFSFLGFSKEDEEVLEPKIKINYKEQTPNIFENTFDCADALSIDLMKKMLTVNPEKRIDINGVLEHPYLAEEQTYMEVNLPV